MKAREARGEEGGPSHDVEGGALHGIVCLALVCIGSVRDVEALLHDELPAAPRCQLGKDLAEVLGDAFEGALDCLVLAQVQRRHELPDLPFAALKT